MFWLLISSCAASPPLPSLVEAGETSSYLSWSGDSIVHSSGEAAAVYSAETGSLTVTGVDLSISLREGDVVSRTDEARAVTLMGRGCEVSVDGSVRCDGTAWGRMPPSDLDERAEALLATLVLYRPPGAARVALQVTRLDAPSVSVTASADADGTIREGLSCPGYASDCVSGRVIGSWTPDGLTLGTRTVSLAERWSLTDEGARACAVDDASLCVVLPTESGWSEVGGQRMRLQGKLQAWRPDDASWDLPRARAAHIAAVTLLDEALEKPSEPPPPPPP